MVEKFGGFPVTSSLQLPSNIHFWSYLVGELTVQTPSLQWMCDGHKRQFWPHTCNLTFLTDESFLLWTNCRYPSVSFVSGYGINHCTQLVSEFIRLSVEPVFVFATLSRACPSPGVLPFEVIITDPEILIWHQACHKVILLFGVNCCQGGIILFARSFSSHKFASWFSNQIARAAMLKPSSATRRTFCGCKKYIYLFTIPDGSCQQKENWTPIPQTDLLKV